MQQRLAGSSMLQSVTRVCTGVYHLRQSAPLAIGELGLNSPTILSSLKPAEIAGARGIAGNIGVDPRVRRASLVEGPIAQKASRALRHEIETVFGRFLDYLGFPSRTYDGDQIVVYDPNDHFGQHRDVGRNSPNRRLSLVRCVEMNCLGGELAFPEADVTVRSQPGDLILFASSILHASLPVRSGRKVIFVTWLVS